MKYAFILVVFTTLFLASCNRDDTIITNAPEATQGIMSAEKQQEIQDSLSNENLQAEESVQEDTITEENTVLLQQESVVENQKNIELTTGTYTEYKPELIGSKENTVLFFAATWCPSCRAADAKIITEVIPENLVILKTDYDSETELKKKYGVVTQHTFVLVDAQWDMIKKWVGGTSVSDITEKL